MIRSNQKKHWQEYSLLLIAAAILFLRMPQAFLKPFLWMEEGQVYLKAALDFGPASLWQIHQGYVLPLTNLVMYGASLLPLEWAPRLTLGFSLVMALLPIWVLWGCRFEAPLDDARMKLVLSFAYLLSPHSTEILLHAHTYGFFMLVAGAFLAVAAPPEYGRARLALWGFLCLSNPFMFLLLPLVFERWLSLRQMWLRPVFLILIITSIMHGVIHMTDVSHYVAARGTESSWSEILAVLSLQLWAIPMIGSELGRALGREMLPLLTSWLMLPTLLLFWWIVIEQASLQGKNATRWLLHALVAGIMIMPLVMGDSQLYLTDVFGGRYFFLPSVYIIIGLIHLIYQTERPSIVGLFLVPILFQSALLLTPMRDEPVYLNEDQKLLARFVGEEAVEPYAIRVFEDGVVYKDEIARWRLDHHTAVRLHPSSWLLK